MAETMIEKAKQLELPRVLAFTYGPKFLVKLDIKVMEHSSLSHKACNDGRNCQKYQACDEIAVMWILATAAVETLSDFPMAKRP